MDIYEKLYLRIRKDPSLAAGAFPTAIMTYYQDDAKFLSRKETCDNWANGSNYDYATRTYIKHENPELESCLIDNVLQEGFKIQDYNTRYRTDNKVFEIVDPRGFVLEIYTDNLMDLILSCDIKNGVIQGKFCWARNGNKNVLISEAEADKIRKAYTRIIEIGSAVQLKSGETVYTYLGRQNIIIMDHEVNYRYTSDYRNTEYDMHYSCSQSKMYLFAYKDKEGKINLYRTKSLVKHTVVDDSAKSVEASEVLHEKPYSTYSRSSDLVAITDDKNYEIPFDDFYENLKSVYWGSAKYNIYYKGKHIKIADNKVDEPIDEINS